MGEESTVRLETTWHVDTVSKPTPVLSTPWCHFVSYCAAAWWERVCDMLLTSVALVLVLVAIEADPPTRGSNHTDGEKTSRRRTFFSLPCLFPPPALLFLLSTHCPAPPLLLSAKLLSSASFPFFFRLLLLLPSPLCRFNSSPWLKRYVVAPYAVCFVAALRCAMRQR